MNKELWSLRARRLTALFQRLTQNQQKLIGGSLSRCIPDIARGEVNYSQIEMIRSGPATARSKGTAYKTEEQFAAGLERYAATAWDYGTTDEERLAFAARCKEIAWRLYREGKFHQLRLTGENDGLDREKNHWFDAETEQPVTISHHSERQAWRMGWRRTLGYMAGNADHLAHQPD